MHTFYTPAYVYVYIYICIGMPFHANVPQSGEDLEGGIPTQSKLVLNPGQHFCVHQLKPIIRQGNYGGDSPSCVIFLSVNIMNI